MSGRADSRANAASPTAASAVVRAGVARGRALFNRADYWGSHEALEGAWQVAPPGQREVLQGLIQVGAAFHKYVVQDNPRGAGLLLDRALSRLDTGIDGSLGLALDPLCGELRTWARRIAQAAAPDGPLVGLPRLEWAQGGSVEPIKVDMARVNLVEHAGGRAALVALSSDGVTGWGECRMPWGVYGVWESLIEGLLPGVLAEPVAVPSEVTVVWSDVVREPTAVAGIEAALWDLWSRRLGLSLSEALGHPARPVALAGRVRGGDAHLVASAVHALTGRGYRQLIVPARPNADRRVLPGLLAGADVPFAIDLGGAYRVADFQALAVLDGLGAVFMAQPVPCWDVAQSLRLRRWLSTPLSLGAWPADGVFRAALELGAFDITHVDPGLIGLTEAVHIAAEAGDRGIPLWVTSTAVTAVGALADLALAAHPGVSLPSDLSGAVDDAARSVVAPDATGAGQPGLGPGLGMTPDPTWLNAVTVRRVEMRA